MMNRKLLFALPVLAVALMGQACPNQDVQVRNILATTCPAVDVAYAHYLAVTDVVSAGVKQRVEQAKRISDGFCANPSTATTTSVMANAAAAYLAVRQALNEAKSVQVAHASQRPHDHPHPNGLEEKIEKLERSVNVIKERVENSGR